VIGPDGVAVASLAEEQDAIDLARELNRAYSAGQAIAFQQLDRRSGPAERRKDSMSEKAKGGRRVIAGGRRAFDDEIPF
ncbi:MAG TPA: hypothetical protein VD867_05300, partial [Burkholderiales bacterium]|nr:hypothetical protein [Burkholderiales bacterium]